MNAPFSGYKEPIWCCEISRPVFPHKRIITVITPRPLPFEAEAVLQIPAPETISHLRSFLGLCNFFRAHLPAFAGVSALLTDLLKGSKHGRQRLRWNLACDRAFVQLKAMLTSAPLLRHVNPTLRTVHIDASQHAVGAVLVQCGRASAGLFPVA